MTIFNLNTNDLGTLIKENKINIIFGDFNEEKFQKLNEAFDIPVDKSNPSIYIYIRNKYLDGVNGQPIPHDCTIKLIKNNVYKYDGMKGVPFYVYPKPKLAIDYDIDRNDKKYAIKFIKENQQDILDYWFAENNTEGQKKMKKIENKIHKKYGV